MKGPCVVYCTTSSGTRFGGFNSVGFSSSDDYAASSKAFLFCWPEESAQPLILRKVSFWLDLSTIAPVPFNDGLPKFVTKLVGFTKQPERFYNLPWCDFAFTKRKWLACMCEIALHKSNCMVCTMDYSRTAAPWRLQLTVDQAHGCMLIKAGQPVAWSKKSLPCRWVELKQPCLTMLVAGHNGVQMLWSLGRHK